MMPDLRPAPPHSLGQFDFFRFESHGNPLVRGVFTLSETLKLP